VPRHDPVRSRLGSGGEQSAQAPRPLFPLSVAQGGLEVLERRFGGGPPERKPCRVQRPAERARDDPADGDVECVDRLADRACPSAAEGRVRRVSMSAASFRLCTSSLWRSVDTCRRTVTGDRNSRSAISAVGISSASSSRTSCSRAVSS
jgi:hypothetical protein